MVVTLVLPEASPLGRVLEPEPEVLADVLLVALHVLHFDFLLFFLVALDLHLLQLLHVVPLLVLQGVHGLLLLLFDLVLGFWFFLCFGFVSVAVAFGSSWCGGFVNIFHLRWFFLLLLLFGG